MSPRNDERIALAEIALEEHGGRHLLEAARAELDPECGYFSAHGIHYRVWCDGPDGEDFLERLEDELIRLFDGEPLAEERAGAADSSPRGRLSGLAERARPVPSRAAAQPA